jgi:hypothetical protein
MFRASQKRGAQSHTEGTQSFAEILIYTFYGVKFAELTIRLCVTLCTLRNILYYIKYIAYHRRVVDFSAYKRL